MRLAQNSGRRRRNAPITLKVPYRGKEGERLLKRMQEKMAKDIPTEVPVRTVHTGTKISKYFRLKDKTEDRHISNFIYKRNCRNKKCKDDYIGETARRKEIRSGDHAGKDKKSHILQHSTKTKHPRARIEDFQILATNYPNRRKRRLCEAMFIRDEKPSLNKQKDSYKLTLFA